MMFGLTADVFAHDLDVGRAHAEFPITDLPREIRIPLVLGFIHIDEDVLTCSTIFAGAWFFDWAKRMWI